MGSRFLPSCFPRGSRRRQRRESGSKGGQQGGPPSPEAELCSDLPGPRSRSTASTRSESEALGASSQAYFSGKARVSFRHQLDSERDSTA